MIPSIIDGIGHAGDAAGLADVGRDALERHHGDGAGILGDLGLIGRDDIHDDAALEHLGEALLGGPGGRFDGHVCRVPLVARARIAGRVWPRGRRPFESAEPLARGDYRTSASRSRKGAAAARVGSASATGSRRLRSRSRTRRRLDPVRDRRGAAMPSRGSSPRVDDVRLLRRRLAWSTAAGLPAAWSRHVARQPTHRDQDGQPRRGRPRAHVVDQAGNAPCALGSTSVDAG